MGRRPVLERVNVNKWLSSRAAATILRMTPRQLRHLEGPDFHLGRFVGPNGTPSWWALAEEVEKKRIERLGPTEYDREKIVLTELAEGKTAQQILLGHKDIRLSQIEAIRESAARLSDAIVISGQALSRVRQIFGAEIASAEELVREIETMVRENRRMAADLLRPRSRSNDGPTG